MKLKLPKVTLLMYENRDLQKAQEVIEICKHYADFHSILLITDIKRGLPYETIESMPIRSLKDYSRFCLVKMNSYIKSDFVLTIHIDGFILNANAFSEEFYKWDYIGAPWYFDNPPTVGNGGFSWRSKKLLNAIDQILPRINCNYLHDHEDIVISVQLRPVLEQHFNIKFAPYEIADKFSVETKGKWNGEFGFHNYKFVNPEKDGWENPLNK